MKATAFAVVQDGVIGFACCYCRDSIKTNRGELTMTHGLRSGIFGRKSSTCPFAGKTFKVPVFDLEEAEC